MTARSSTAGRDLGGFTLLGEAETAAGWEVEIAVPADARWFDGHFPGHPILPAVAQLALVDRLLRRFAGPGRLSAVDRFRLPQAVAPGDRLRVALTRPGDGGRVAFTLRRGEDAVSGGAGAWTPGGEPPPAAGAGATAAADAANTAELEPSPAPDPADHLPHRGPALLVRRIVERDAAGIRCDGDVPIASPLAAAGRAPAFAALELAAQAAGLHEILHTAESAAVAPTAPQIGYLVRVRDAAFAADLPTATPVQVRVDREGAAPPLTLYRFHATLAGTEVARGTFATYAVPAVS